jgi:hypothetical protein
VNLFCNTKLPLTLKKESSKMNTLKIVCAAVLLASAMAVNSTVFAKERETGRGTGPVVFVTSQGLYYDSIVVVDSLPANGRFQQLIPGENGLETEYGPGEVGHLGGRWWIDINGDGIMNDGDRFFLCPLLGPGRETL